MFSLENNSKKFHKLKWFNFSNLSFKLTFNTKRNVTNTYGGELFLGGTDPQFYTGSFTYVSLSSQTYWQFTVNR